MPLDVDIEVNAGTDYQARCYSLGPPTLPSTVSSHLINDLEKSKKSNRGPASFSGTPAYVSVA